MARRLVTAPASGTPLPAATVVRRRRRRLAGVLVALLVAGALLGGWLWLRDSPLVEVREVVVTGLSTSEEPQVRAALHEAAQDMTTLHVREDALRAAVDAYPSVAGLRVDADPPHRLTIQVRERRPVAVLDTGGQRVAVTGSGRLLRGLRPARELPALRVRALPAGETLRRPRLLAMLEIAAAAPAPLRPRLATLGAGDRGLTVSLREGPELIFGTARDLRAKWAAAARVLAAPAAAGATYLDLRVPERVAAGGRGPVAPEPTPTPELLP